MVRTSDRIVLPIAALVLSASVAMSAAGSAQAALSKEDAACRYYIGQKVITLADTLLREEIKCQQNRSLGKLDAGIDCSDPDGVSFPGATTVAKAASNLTSKAVSKCASASAPATNGYTSCPSPCDGAVPSIASYSDVAACLICQTKAEAATAIQLVYGANPPIQGTKDSAWKCQNTYVGTAMRSYIKKRLTEQRKCQYKEDRELIDTTDCQNADLTGAVAKAAAKLAGKIAHCSDSDLTALTSCATTTSAEGTCVRNSADSMSDSLFPDVYPEASAPASDCAADNFLDVSGAAGAGTGYPKPSLSASCSSTTVTVQSNGIPTYLYVAETPNGLQAHNYNFTFPRFPNLAANTTPVPLLGNIGVAVNGIPIYGVNEGAQPPTDAYGDPIAASILDDCGSHSAQQGTFHNHKLEVKCLTQSAVSLSQPWNSADPSPNERSPIVGYAFDGFPIYGHYECTDSSCTSLHAMLSGWDSTGYQQGTVGCASSAVCSSGYCTDVMINGALTTACVPKTCIWSNNKYTAKPGSQYLDQCNGHTGPDGDYHYHTTATFPYILGCYHGTPTNNGGTGTPPGGSCPSN
jgi:YHYH protein